MLRDEFKAVPKDLKVAAGEEAILECHPPEGNPPPTLLWKKDGDILDFNDRYVYLLYKIVSSSGAHQAFDCR